MSKIDLGETLHVADLVAESTYEFDEDPNVGVISVLAPESAAPAAEEGTKK